MASRTRGLWLGVLAIGVSVAFVRQQSTTYPSWAYGFSTPPSEGGAAGRQGQPGAAGRGGGPPAQPDTTRKTLSGASGSFTLQQIRDQYGPADWFPESHPSMPPVVANGRREAQIAACALCHYPNGKGRPENAGISGLPYTYFVQTIKDFRSDARKSADTRKANTRRMIDIAKAMTDDEIDAAAKYFSSMKWTPWIRVVETDTVPTTRIAAGMFIPLDGAEAGREPIGLRIIEVPESPAATELRDPRASFIAYVPRGSLQKGEVLATRGQCALCHGSNLEGLGPVPGIAGRSPSYTVRQLYDMQRGARTGVWSELMKRIVTPLSVEDMIHLAAYTASRTP
jgi:cytochrome c553